MVACLGASHVPRPFEARCWLGTGLADRAAGGSLSTPLREKFSAAVPYPFVHYFSIDPL